VRTCLLAARAAKTRVWCIYGHVPITTASTSGSSMISDQHAAACMAFCSQGNACTCAGLSLSSHVTPGCHNSQYAFKVFMTVESCAACICVCTAGACMHMHGGHTSRQNQLWPVHTLPIPNSAAASLDDSNDRFATETICTPFIFCRLGI